MTESSTRILKYILFGLAVLATLIVLFINRNLAALADLLYPGSAVWTHAVLLAIEAVAFFWFWRGLFGGRKHLLRIHDHSEEGRRLFAAELTRRMKSNPLIRKAGLVPEGNNEEYLAKCLALLREKADEEIEQNAKRIFLATALCQNGRLDALLVFVCLCRLVWRISAIYNQRPHPREIASLYWAVVTSTFLALSLEELDISTEITVGFAQAFHAMVPAGMTASIPFAGKALQTFTSSAIDGTANCYLTLRAGIIARNAYAFGLAEVTPSRAFVYREAGSILLAMSSTLMDRLAGAAADTIAEAVRDVQDKTVQAGKNLMGGIGFGSSAGRLVTETAMGIGQGIGMMGRGTVNAVRATGNGIAHATAATTSMMSNAVSSATTSTLNMLKKTFRKKDRSSDSDKI